MRISDWSSDVCSSDLRFLRAIAEPDASLAGQRGHFGLEDRFPGKARAHRRFDKVEFRQRRPEGFVVVRRVPVPQKLVERVLAAALNLDLKHNPDGAQIGRASCRETGCQYV